MDPFCAEGAYFVFRYSSFEDFTEVSPRFAVLQVNNGNLEDRFVNKEGCVHEANDNAIDFLRRFGVEEAYTLRHSYDVIFGRELSSSSGGTRESTDRYTKFEGLNRDDITYLREQGIKVEYYDKKRTDKPIWEVLGGN